MNLQTAVAEDYLRTIYKLEHGEGPVTTSQLAYSLNVSSASVSDMLKKLARKRLITYKPYYGATLTDQGMKVALAVTRKHRLWEMFLVKTLEFSWDEVHSVADKLEHYTPQILEQRIDKLLGHPTIDPHGDPIPQPNGELTSEELTSVANLAIETPAIISRVSDDSPELLQYLDKVGLQLGYVITVKEVMPFDGNLRIEINNHTIFLSSKLSRCIFVRIIDK